MPYFIGRVQVPARLPENKPHVSQGDGVISVSLAAHFSSAMVDGRRFSTRQAAMTAALEKWPDGSGVVVEARNASQALELIGGERRRSSRSIKFRLTKFMDDLRWRLFHRPARFELRDLLSGDDDDSSSGSRVPRRSPPGGLSSTAAVSMDDQDREP